MGKLSRNAVDGPEADKPRNGNTSGQWRKWPFVVLAAVCGLALLFLALRDPSGRSSTDPARIFNGDIKLPGSQTAVIAPGEFASFAAETVQNARRVTRQILNYGHGQNEVGMIWNEGETPVGPESFTIAPDGNILVADRVNQRIVVCDPSGAFLRAIEIPGITVNDVMADRQGRLFVYDQRTCTLHQYDSSGVAIASLQLDPADIDTRGYFHIAGDSVYFADAAARDVLLATVKGGILEAPPPNVKRRAEGIHGVSGLLYSISVVKGEGLQLQLRDPASPTPQRNVRVDVPDLLSACFVGEDGSRRFYVQVERFVAGKVTLDMLTFGPGGEWLGAIPMPENDYAIWTSKLAAVRPDGAVVQFVPGERQARINLIE
jgi:hypothetical protein